MLFGSADCVEVAEAVVALDDPPPGTETVVVELEAAIDTTDELTELIVTVLVVIGGGNEVEDWPTLLDEDICPLPLVLVVVCPLPPFDVDELPPLSVLEVDEITSDPVSVDERAVVVVVEQPSL